MSVDGPGLVVNSTTPTQPFRARVVPDTRRVGAHHVVDPKQGRCRRLARAVKWAAHLHSQPAPGRRPQRCAMVTLTYAQVDGWSPAHMTAFCGRVREWFRRLGHQFRYVWVAELQKRGAVHYHMLVWLPKGVNLPKPDKRGWWPHGMTQVVQARKPVGYMVKYASKFDSKSAFPRGLRAHGSGGFDTFGKQVRHWWSLPGWLRSQVGVGDKVQRMDGGGFHHVKTGTVVASPWRFCFTDGTGHVRELWEYQSGVNASGPYSRLEPVVFTPGEVAFQ